MAGKKLANPLKESLVGIVGEAARKIFKDGVVIRCVRNFWISKQLLDFRAKDEGVIGGEIVERFDAEAIARAKKSALRTIPNGEAPHAVETFNARGAPLTVGLEN